MCVINVQESGRKCLLILNLSTMLEVSGSTCSGHDSDHHHSGYCIKRKEDITKKFTDDVYIITVCVKITSVTIV
jgi:hypothetical protein